MSSTPLSTEQRLHSARKRFEELKKLHNFTGSRPSGMTSSLKQKETKVCDKNLSNKDELLRTIEAQKEEMKKLRDENEELKLECVHLKEKVVDLETQITGMKDNDHLIDEKEKSFLDNSEVALESEKDETLNLVETSDCEKDVSLIEKNETICEKNESICEKVEASESLKDESSYVDEQSPKSVNNSGDYRERLLSWKGWQVDMRDWKGCQTAQVAI